MDGNTDTTLKPCPFCGSEPVMRRGGRYGFWAICQHCGAALRMSDTEEDAANAWNRRAKDGRTSAALEEFVNHASCLYHCDIHRLYPETTSCDGVLADEGECPMKPECDAVFKGRAALSAPARNCDRYGDEDDAFAAWHDALNDGDVVSVRNAFAWLFAKAEGKEASNG